MSRALEGDRLSVRRHVASRRHILCRPRYRARDAGKTGRRPRGPMRGVAPGGGRPSRCGAARAPRATWARPLSVRPVPVPVAAGASAPAARQGAARRAAGLRWGAAARATARGCVTTREPSRWRAPSRRGPRAGAPRAASRERCAHRYAHVCARRWYAATPGRGPVTGALRRARSVWAGGDAGGVRRLVLCNPRAWRRHAATPGRCAATGALQRADGWRGHIATPGRSPAAGALQRARAGHQHAATLGQCRSRRPLRAEARAARLTPPGGGRSRGCGHAPWRRRAPRRPARRARRRHGSRPPPPRRPRAGSPPRRRR